MKPGTPKLKKVVCWNLELQSDMQLQGQLFRNLSIY